VNSGFLFEYGGEVGLDSLRSPCGRHLAVQNGGAILSNPVEDSRPSLLGNIKAKKPEREFRLSL